MMGAMLIIGVVGFLLDRIMATFEARLQRWRLA
jgi:ABC-type nitrate/sulfonate/bicarbonate transport system permease component